MTNYLGVIKDYDLGSYLKIILKENSSNILPYHNFYHILCVSYNAQAIATSLGLFQEEIRLLMLAALFHDFNHSGGKLPDSENVKNAIASFLEHSSETEEDNNFVVEIIKATEYPYVIKEDELSLYQKIIRDADLMQVFEKNYLQQNVFGLMQELKFHKLEMMLDGSLSFWQNCKFHTDYAKKAAMRNMPSIIKDVEFLKEILL